MSGSDSPPPNQEKWKESPGFLWRDKVTKELIEIREVKFKIYVALGLVTSCCSLKMACWRPACSLAGVRVR